MKNSHIESPKVLLKRISENRKKQYDTSLAKPKKGKPTKSLKNYDLKIIGNNKIIETWFDVKLESCSVYCR